MCGILESRNRLYILWLNIQRILAISLLIKYHYISAPNLHNSLSIGSEEYFRHVKDRELLWPLEYVLVHHHDHLSHPKSKHRTTAGNNHCCCVCQGCTLEEGVSFRQWWLVISEGRKDETTRHCFSPQVKACIDVWLCFIISLWIHHGPWFKTRVPGYRRRLVLD